MNGISYRFVRQNKMREKFCTSAVTNTRVRFCAGPFFLFILWVLGVGNSYFGTRYFEGIKLIFGVRNGLFWEGKNRLLEGIQLGDCGGRRVFGVIYRVFHMHAG